MALPLLAILLQASESLAYFKNRHIRNMSLYYPYYLKKMPHWKPFFILTHLGSIQENEFHRSY